MKRTVSVVVLGDIGHSPRMKNHARCLANDGIDVRLVGYGGASLEKDITDNGNIQIMKMTPPPNYKFVLKRYVNYIIKCIWQSITLLCCIGLPDYILLQNPPSIPVLPICFIYTKFLQLLGKKIELIIDWHNYGYSIMALSLGKKGTAEHPLVRLSRLLEGKVKWFWRVRAPYNLSFLKCLINRFKKLGMHPVTNCKIVHLHC